MLKSFCLAAEKSAWVWAMVFLVLVAIQLPAQTTGTIYGTVSDSTGAVIAGATVTAQNLETNQKRTAETGADGSYTFALLPVGLYAIRAEAKGFQSQQRTDLELQVQSNLRVDFGLQVGTVTQQVEVIGGAPLVDTATATLGKVVEERRIANLPLNGRNYLQLGVLQAGVTPPIAGINVTASGTNDLPGGTGFLFSVNGMRITANNHLLDGVNNVEPVTGSAMIVPSVDAIREFRILTNDYKAEYGRAGGSIVTVVSKGGTNELHGSAYDFLRNDKVDARNFFSPGVPALKQNQFGATLGGPIVRDRTFFFASYEGFRQRHGIPTSAPVPTLLERAGNFSQSAVKPVNPVTRQPFPGNTITTIDPVARNVVKLWPAPNVGTNTWSAAPGSSNDRDQVLARLDHSFLAGKNNLSGRYVVDNITRVIPLGHFSSNSAPFVQVPGFASEDADRFQNLVLADTHIFSYKLLNDLRLSYQRAGVATGKSVNPIDRTSLGFTFPLASSLLVPPAVGVSGVTGMGPNLPNDRTYNFYQIAEGATLSSGRHTLKFGIDVRHTRLATLFPSLAFGAYTFNGLVTGNAFADFLLGTPFLFLQAGGKEDKSLRQTAYSFYGQDDFRLSRNLTVNLGLRYELIPGFTEREHLLLTFVPGKKSVLSPLLPLGMLRGGDPGIPDTVFPTPKHNFAPRIGLAWDIFGDGKTSLRMGYGIFYDESSLVQTINVQQPPDFQPINVLIFPPSFADPFAGKSPFKPPFQVPVPVAPGTTATWIAPNLKLGYVQQWNLTLQRQVNPSLAVELAYVGNKGTHLQGNLDVNQPVLGPGVTRGNAGTFRPFPLLTGTFQVSSVFDSNYNGLQATATQRLSHGLTFQASYTWSKAIDDGSLPSGFFNVPGQNAGRAQDNRNLRAERGLSAFDLRNRFVLSALYELPFLRHASGLASSLLGGWRLNGILTLQSGRPFTVRDSSDPNFDQLLENDRPNLLRNPNLPDGQQAPTRWFDTQAFQRVIGPGVGNSGRNIVFTDGLGNLDMGLDKEFHVTERKYFEFRWEIFNLFNHPNFGVPDIDLNSPSFGRIFSTAAPERQIQFALKFVF